MLFVPTSRTLGSRFIRAGRLGVLKQTDEQIIVAGRYRLEQEIGRGGMGRVHQAFDLHLEERVAIKLLTKLGDETSRGRFRREVALARKVTHPNVCRMYDIGETEDELYLTMELVLGQSLQQRMAEDEAPKLPECLRILEAVARGLAAAHDVGVIHRDLKPANILLSSDGRILLTDFGIARGVRDGTRTHEPGRMLGTPFYMSPEQVTDNRIGPPADVYALGVMFYEMITEGVNPFGTTDPVTSALRRVHMDAPSPADASPHLPESICELVMRMLRRDPSERPNALTVAARASHLQTPVTATAERLVHAAIRAPNQSLAVLPFQFRGAEEDGYLGEGIAEELIDVLSQTKGLHVLTFAVTHGLGTDPRGAGVRALGPDAIVTGTVQARKGQVRVKARLSDPDGRQTWSGGFDAPFEEFFEMQERLARRIAESLRLELGIRSVADRVPPESVPIYMQAREILRRRRRQVDEAVDLMDQAVDMAPQCATYLAAHALAHMRSASFSDSMDQPEARLLMAEKSLERALAVAPDQPDTQLASALFYEARGDLVGELGALFQTLELAPTSAPAHARLGEIQLFAGMPREGKQRLRHALELDPTTNGARMELSRAVAFEGKDEEAIALLDAASMHEGASSLSVITAHFRTKLYLGQRDHVTELKGWLTLQPAHALMRLLCEFVEGTVGLEAVDELYRQLKPWLTNAWFRCLAAETIAEACLVRRYPERALELLEEVEDVMYDIDWLQRCPLTQELHADPRMQRLMDIVRLRTEGLWTHTGSRTSFT